MENPPNNPAIRRAQFIAVLEPPAAVVLLIVLATILYKPHIFQLGGLKLLLPVCSIIASMGCITLSRRWLGTFDASFWAGLLYGFGPFGLSFAAYHPLAGLCYAALPWLFCPAVFYHYRTSASLRRTILTAALTALPFAMVMAAFHLAAKFAASPLFPMPKNRMLEMRDIQALLTPMAHNPHSFILGFYHVPLVLAVMGGLAYAVSGRFWALPAIAAGAILCAATPIFDVSPIMWAAVPAMFVCILCGLGMQTLAVAGKADRKWLLLCAATAGLLAGINAIMYITGQMQDVYLITTYRFLTAAGLTMLVLLMTTIGLRLTMLRWICIWAALLIDVLYSAPALVDRLF